MTLRLWRATVEVEVYIASEEEPSDMECQEAAEAELSDGNEVEVWPVEEVSKLSELSEDWIDSVPRGNANGEYKTCRQIVNEAEDARLEKAWNTPLPNQKELPLGDGTSKEPA